MMKLTLLRGGPHANEERRTAKDSLKTHVWANWFTVLYTTIPDTKK